MSVPLSLRMSHDALGKRRELSNTQLWVSPTHLIKCSAAWSLQNYGLPVWVQVHVHLDAGAHTDVHTQVCTHSDPTPGETLKIHTQLLIQRRSLHFQSTIYKVLKRTRGALAWHASEDTGQRPGSAGPHQAASCGSHHYCPVPSNEQQKPISTGLKGLQF